MSSSPGFRLSSLSVRRPVTTMMVFLAITVLGLVSFRGLPMQLIPNISMPRLGVYMVKPGASASETLEELTKPVEGLAAEMPRVQSVESWTGSWGTWVAVTLEPGTDLRFATLDMQERLISFQQGLEDRRTMLEVFPFTTDQFKNLLFELAVEGPSEEELAEIVRNKIEPGLKAVSGVAKVDVGGLSADAADAEIDPVQLSGYGLDFGRVYERISSAATEDTFLGTLDVPGERHYVRMDSAVRTVEELAALTVDDLGVVRLRDVATIRKGDAVDEWVYRSNGKYAIGLRIDQEEGENLVRTAEKVRKRIEELNAALAASAETKDVSVRIEFDAAERVLEALIEVRDLALTGAFLALLVPLFFFRSWRIALIIFISVPVSIIATFNVFSAMNMSLNMFSIVGLALAVGMLVDNSIVVVENIVRLHRERHFSPVEAASRGGDEIGRALLASTLTTVVFFIPFRFIDGDFKLIIREPAIAFIAPLLLSLLIALTLSAMLAGRLLARGGRQSQASLGPPRRDLLREFYRWILAFSLRHRGVVTVAIMALLAFVFLESCSLIREESNTRERRDDDFRVYFVVPDGTTTAETSQVVAAVESRLSEHEDVEEFSAWFRGDEGNIEVRLFKMDERPSGRSLEEVRATIIDFIGPLPGGQVSLDDPNQPTDASILSGSTRGALTLKALERETLLAYAARLMPAMENIPSVYQTRIVENDPSLQYQANVDRERTRLFDIQPMTLSYYIEATRSQGSISSLQLKNGEDRTDVTISVSGALANTPQQVANLPIYTPTGSTVGLGEVSRFSTETTPGQIYRSDRQASLTIEYSWVPGSDQGEILRQVKELLARLPNPGGAIPELGGSQAQLDQQRQDFVFCLLVSILLIYVVMAAVFESYWIPFVIVATTPLVVIGIVFALAISRLPFDEMAGFGVLLLVGVVVNNGIVLLDTAMRFQAPGPGRRGHRPMRAVFQAADQRLRPILMTFLTTLLGLLPLAVSGDEDSIWRPVAVTVLGGLTSATFLTLLVLPCFYLIGEDFMRWFKPHVHATTQTMKVHLSSPKLLLMDLLRGLRAVFWRIPKTMAATAWIALSDLAAFVLPWRPKWRRKKQPVVVRPPLDSSLLVSPLPPLGSSVIEVQNLSVVFAPASPRAVRRRLWSGHGHPIGHGPVEGFEALHRVNLRFGQGVIGLLGPNGAGKTTLLRCIAGLQPPTRGTVRLFGVDARESTEAVGLLLGYLPQTHGHFEALTLRDSLRFHALLQERTRARVLGDQLAPEHLKERIALLPELRTEADRRAAILAAAREVHLADVLDQRVGTFSGGMRQRAGLARLLLMAPPIILVDEPTAGLDPVERIRIRLLLARLARQRTVVFSTHIVEDLEGTCEQIAVLDRGRVVYAGATEGLRRAGTGGVATLEEGLLATLGRG